MQRRRGREWGGRWQRRRPSPPELARRRAAAMASTDDGSGDFRQYGCFAARAIELKFVLN